MGAKKENEISISVIMPAHNESRVLQSAVLHTADSFFSVGVDFEIIIVDDNSIDDTKDIAARLANGYPYIRCYRHEKNQGSGGAFKTGIYHAKKDYVMFVPMDNPLDVEDIEAYLPIIPVCDITVGYRIERAGYTHFARFASFVYNRMLVPFFFNIRLTDVNWIQVYRRSLFTEGVLSFENLRFFYFVEILVWARRKGLKIGEVPAKMRKRMYGRPTNTKLSIMISTLIAMVRFFIRLKIEEKTRR